MLKFCKSCRIEKPLSEYHHSIKNKEFGKHYPDSLCKSCKATKNKTWAKANQKKMNRYNIKAKLKSRYGMAIQEYDAMIIAQNNLCAICNQSQTRRNLSVDHCHQTNRVRALLCDRCNLALGMVNDDLDIVERIKQYLILHKK